jgi:DHA1 family bicyclomycin/chloramphenicol resistance-like MFS transporter
MWRKPCSSAVSRRTDLPNRTIPPAARGITVVLGALASLGPFSIDTYLPSFNDIGASLLATPLEVQQTLTAYLLPYALMTLWHGPLSDALGRRRVILVSVALFALASAGCMFATRIEHLWLMRALQGITAGAGMVVARAIVRDLYDGAPAQRLIAHITMVFALAPAIAPVLGGWLQVLVRLARGVCLSGAAQFRALAGVLVPASGNLPRDQRHSLHARYLARAYWKVLTSSAFLLTCGALALNFAAFFIYVLSAPVFLMRHLGVSATGFLWLFGPAMSGLMIGAWLSGRLAGKWSAARTIAAGYLLMGTAAVLNIGLNLALPPALPWSVLPLFGFTLGMSLAMPSLTLQALDLFPEQRGLAASCQTFLQSGGNAFAAAVIAPALWGSLTRLALGMGGLLLLGAGATLIQRRRSAA